MKVSLRKYVNITVQVYMIETEMTLIKKQDKVILEAAQSPVPLQQRRSACECMGLLLFYVHLKDLTDIRKHFISCLHSGPSIPVLKLKMTNRTWADIPACYIVLQIY